MNIQVTGTRPKVLNKNLKRTMCDVRPWAGAFNREKTDKKSSRAEILAFHDVSSVGSVSVGPIRPPANFGLGHRPVAGAGSDSERQQPYGDRQPHSQDKL